MSSARPLVFYFDFVSTFSYIGVQRIDDVAARHGRTVDWRLISLGHLFQAQGVTPPPAIPAKFKYYQVDFPRSCARAGLPCRMPPSFPPDVKLARLLFWYLKVRNEALSHAYARIVSSAIYGRGESVATPEELTALCRALPDISVADITAAATDAAAKRALIDALEAAKADDVFGAPFMICDGEPFWGADRLDALEEHLAAAGRKA